jgi:hypothetical protein
MKAPAQTTTFKPAPSGAHPAILFQLIDLGTQEAEYQGKVKHQRKIRMGFELHSEEAKTDEGKPMVVGRTFTLSSYESAQLRKFIEGWRGQEFSDDEAAAFDYKTMLGKPCILNITHNKSSNGKTYANIDSAMRLMKGMDAPAQVNPGVYFYMGDDEAGYSLEEPVFSDLPDWMRESIERSPEYRRATGAPEPDAKPAEEETQAPFDDAIPF